MSLPSSYVSVSPPVRRVQRSLGEREMRKNLRDEKREGNQNYVFVSLSLSKSRLFSLVQAHNAKQLLPRKPYSLKIQAGELEKNER